MGYKIPKSQFVHETLEHLFSNIDQTQWQQLLLGLTWWFMLFASRRIAANPKYKKRWGWLRPSAPLLTCMLAIIVGGNMDYFNGCGFPLNYAIDYNNVEESSFWTKCNATVSNKLVVGKIPMGVSEMGSAQLLSMDKLGRVFTTAVSCALIGYMESIAIAKSLASKHKYNIDPGQELVALGVANFLGSMTSSYPVTGSFSRSAVNNTIGAQTQLAGLITGCLLLFTLLALTPIFYFLPKFALAAIVISSVTNLVDYKEFFHLYKVKKQDCLLWVIAFLGTLFLGVQIGLMLSVTVSLLLVIAESVRPQMSMLWRLPGTQIYRNIKQESDGQFVPGIICIRIGASMYFANVSFIRDYINKMLDEFSAAAQHKTTTKTDSPLTDADGAKEPIRYIVIEMTPVTSIDSTALHMLEDMHRDLQERGIRLAFSTISTRVEDTFKRAGLLDKVGAHWIHPSVHSAVQHCLRNRSDTADGESANAAAAVSADGDANSVMSSPRIVAIEHTDVPGSRAVGGKPADPASHL